MIDTLDILNLPADKAIPILLEHFRIRELISTDDFGDLVHFICQFIEADNEAYRENACDNCEDRMPDEPMHNEGYD